MSILGNDISSNQGDIDFHKMKQAGCQFVYMRVGLGWNIDRRVNEYRQQVKEANIPWGLYWLPWPTAFSQGLLDNYFRMVDDDWGDLPPVLDVETQGLGLGIFKMWADQVIEKTGRKPIIYTRASHFDLYSNPKDLKGWLGENTDLWVAHYGVTNPAIPKDSWDTYLIHQYSADGNMQGEKYGVSSQSIDIDSFNGDELAFAEFIGAGEVQPPQPSEDYVEIVAHKYLRFRPEPLLNLNIKTLIVERGEVLQIAGVTTYEPPVAGLHDGINWLPVFTPQRYDGDFIGYISADKKYVKYL